MISSLRGAERKKMDGQRLSCWIKVKYVYLYVIGRKRSYHLLVFSFATDKIHPDELMITVIHWKSGEVIGKGTQANRHGSLEGTLNHIGGSHKRSRPTRIAV